MSIKSQGGVFGRNPTFNDVTVDGDLSIAGTLSVGGETITGLSYQGGWNADTNTPDIAASSPVTGQFWIVSTDGSTNVGGITNWTSGDWALYDGTNWQRVEGGNTDLTTGVQGQLAIANGGTGAADAATARTNLGLGTAATTAATDYATAAQGTTADSALQPADIGSTVQGYDADTAKYDDTTANFTGTLQNGGSNVVVDTDIGSTVQAYDADTAKLDVAQTFTATQTLNRATFSGTNSDPVLSISARTDSSNLDFKFIDTDGSVGVSQVHHKSEYYSTDGSQISAKVRTEYADVVGGMNYVISTASGGGSLQDRFKVLSNGNVSIGTFSATGATRGLEVNPSINANGYRMRSSVLTSSNMTHYAFFNTNGQVGGIRTNGTATAYDTSSDYRLKTDVKPMTGATDRLKQLKPVNFAWISDGTRVDGFIAHEAQRIVPEAVGGEKDAVVAYGNITDANGTVIQEDVTEPETLEKDQTWIKVEDKPDYQGIDQSKLVPLLTAALQEAVEKIEALEKRVAALDGKSITTNNVIVAEEII